MLLSPVPILRTSLPARSCQYHASMNMVGRSIVKGLPLSTIRLSDCALASKSRNFGSDPAFRANIVATHIFVRGLPVGECRKVKRMNQLSSDPVERVLQIISGRWKMAILQRLLDGPKRQSELMRLIPEVSQKVLLQQLRQLEEHGMVDRLVVAVVPPNVEYSLTEIAKALEPIADAICDWGQKHAQFGD